MNGLGILGALVGVALAARSKRRRGALDFLTGSRGGLLNTGTIATVAAGAWGLGELFQHRGPQSTTRAPEIPSAQASRPATRADGTELSPDMLRLVRLTIAATLCDGRLSSVEKARLVADAKAANIERLVERELDHPRSLDEICAGVGDPAHARDLYTLAFAVVRADEGVSPVERRWLEDLASRLGLERHATAELESAAIERIDR
ncbi:MAG: tellurite resistance TerB family protein [Planctomycetes bacterium]|nr:tellurite resistance TerB family protein [Planctomycetota bacterium]